MHCLLCRKPKHRFKKPMLKASVVLSKSMIVFVYGGLSNVDINDHLGGTVTVHHHPVCTSVSTIVIYTCHAFKTNESSRMAV